MTAAQDRKAEERRAAAEKAHADLNAAIDALMTPEAWERMVRARRWLRTYSLNNLLMIEAQCPGATDVRPYGARVNPSPNSWKAVGRYAMPGQSAIRIYAPVFKTDEATGEKGLAYFKLVPVFDVSQTDGDPLPEVPDIKASLLTGDAPAMLWDMVAKLIADQGFSLSRAIDPEHPTANGVTSWGPRTVTVRPDVEDAQAVKTLIHELAHIMLGHENRDVSREAGEVEAESVACIVASVAGLDTTAYTVPYVIGWATSREDVRTAATAVLRVSEEILAALDL